MNSRRGFIKQLFGVSGGLLLHSSISAAIAPYLPKDFSALSLSDSPFTDDETYWGWVRQAYNCSPNIINLNNGGVSPSPKATQDALDNYNRFSNEAPTYYMWRILDQNREPLRQNLALLAGCSPDEIAINRNTTEGLNTVIFGLNLKEGDEVVLCKYDYPNMMNAWKQREKRDNIKLQWVDLSLPNENEEEMIAAYVSAFTPKTKVVHLTHIINWCGQILPVRKIADEAHKRGIEVIVDGAHSFALLDYKIPDTGADYFATSLHKFMCAPFGSGMLYIRKEKIQNVWALLSAEKPDGTDIRKFENLGTRSFASEMAIGYSLDFHNMITTERKQKRLFYLKNYWMEQVKDLEEVHFFTSLKPEFSCAIGHFGIKGMKGVDIANQLFADYKIHSVAITHEKIDGVRITPNVYTTLPDLDKLVKGIREIHNKSK